MIWETAEELDKNLALRMRAIRKRKKLGQELLALRSGVSLGSIRRFEQTGQISLLALTKLAMALDCEGELRALFSEVGYENIDEVIHENRK